MNALVIDDDPIVTAILTAMLNTKDYQVLSVDSEATLSQMIEKGNLDFDLALIDLQLVEVSGLLIYKKYLSSYIELDKVIFMSANSHQDAQELYLLPEEAKFLEKPFKGPDLFNLI